MKTITSITFVPTAAAERWNGAVGFFKTRSPDRLAEEYFCEISNGISPEHAKANQKVILALPKLIAALKDMRAALTEHHLRDAKKRFSLCVADAAAGTALHEAGVE
jgi:hypothetical protein